MAATAVDQHQIGPGVAVAIGVFGLRAGETALEDLAHHREIVIGRGLLDIELAILALADALRPRDDHRPERAGSLGWAVVVDFDAVGRLGNLEPDGDPRANFPLAFPI